MTIIYGLREFLSSDEYLKIIFPGFDDTFFSLVYFFLFVFISFKGATSRAQLLIGKKI